MIDNSTNLVYRSIRRRRPHHRLEIYKRVLGSMMRLAPNAHAPEDPARLEVNDTCRPYELAWLLEAWTGRDIKGLPPLPGEFPDRWTS